MNVPLYRLGCAWIAVVLASTALGGEGIDAALLRALTRQGLPDVRGAQWVHVEDSRWGPGPFTSESAGNAWLVKEEPAGVAVVVYDQVHRLRLKRVPLRPLCLHLPLNMESFEGSIEPADLDQDLRELEAALDRMRAKDGAPEKAAPAEGAVAPDLTTVFMLLAQLQRQGKTQWVARLWPKVQAQAGRTLVKDALALLADERAYLADLAWVKNGDPAAYAVELEKWAESLPGNSTERAGTLALAQRLRSQRAPPSKGLSRPAAEAERILLALRPEHLIQLPVGVNWLLPHAEGGQMMLVDMFTMGHPPAQYNAPGWEDQEDLARSLRPPPETLSFAPIRDYLLRRAPSAAALAELLDDRRLLRVFRERKESDLFRPLFMREGADPQRTGKPPDPYDLIRRPFELREIAWALLCGLPPAADWLANDAPARKRVVAWVQSSAKMNEAQLAIAYYEKESSGQAEEAILGHPSAQGLALLRPLYLEPPQVPSSSRNLSRYVAVLGAEREKFVQELMAQPWLEKYGLTKEIARAVHPPRLENLLAELKTADENTTKSLGLDLAFILGPTLDEKTEAGLLQTAAAASSLPAKRLLLSILNQIESEEGGADLPRIWNRRSFAIPEARQALATLLLDKTVLYRDPDYPDDPPFTVADLTHEGIFSSRLSELLDPWREWRKHDPSAANQWAQAVAEAMIADRAAPAFPKMKRPPKQ